MARSHTSGRTTFQRAGHPALTANGRDLLDLGGSDPFGPAEYARLVRVLDQLGTEGAALDILTTGALAVAPGEGIARSDLAGLVGLVRVLRRERPALRLRLLDSDAPLSALPGARAGEDLLARRAGRDHAPRLVPLHGTPAGLPFDGDALQIFTGGLSPLALTLAEDLAVRGARRIWLLSRRPADPAERPPIDLMRGGGAEVMLLDRVDVGDAGALEGVLDAACRAPGRIGRIHHLAGQLDDAPLVELDAGRLEAVLSAKVAGARTLSWRPCPACGPRR